LQIYWTDRDVINWLSENSDDEHLKKVKQTVEQHAAKMEVASRSLQDESALFDEDEADEEDEVILKRTETTEDATEKKQEKEETSKQRLLSKAHLAPEFEGLRTTGSGHRIQDIRELMSVPVSIPLSLFTYLSSDTTSLQVIVTADLTKSPPVIKVYSVNPYAEQKK
jgi:protein SSD1